MDPDRKFKLILIALSNLLFVFPAFSDESYEWEKVNDEKEIQIFIRTIPGNPIIATRGVSIINANILKTANIVKNNTKFKDWVPRLLNANTISEYSQYEWVEYILMDFPWPLNDREFVLKKTMTVDDDGKRISINFYSVKSPLIPGNNKYIRAEVSEGSFILTRINKNKTRMIASMHADLKGLLPVWVINYLQKVWPLRTIKALKKQTGKKQ